MDSSVHSTDRTCPLGGTGLAALLLAAALLAVPPAASAAERGPARRDPAKAAPRQEGNSGFFAWTAPLGGPLAALSEAGLILQRELHRIMVLKPALGPTKLAKHPIEEGPRDPFKISSKLLREAVNDSKDEVAPVVAVPKAQPPALPAIKMTGVMIVGDRRMATAEVERVGTVTLVQGDRVVLNVKNSPDPFEFTVKEIDERHLTILTRDGIEIRALFK